MTGCDCNGMSFISNRWVYTGDCPHRAEQRVAAEMRRNRYMWACERKRRHNTHAARASVVEARIALQAHGEYVPDYESDHETDPHPQDRAAQAAGRTRHPYPLG